MSLGESGVAVGEEVTLSPDHSTVSSITPNGRQTVDTFMNYASRSCR